MDKKAMQLAELSADDVEAQEAADKLIELVRMNAVPVPPWMGVAYKEGYRDGLRAERARHVALVTELAGMFTSGNGVPVGRISVGRTSELFNMIRRALPGWEFEPGS